MRTSRKLTAAALVAAMLLTPALAAGAGDFSDVPSGHWAYASVKSMVEKGIVQGVGNGKFNPGGQISMAEFAAMLARAYYPGEVAAPQAGEAWWEPYAALAEEKGLLNRTQQYPVSAEKATGAMTRFDAAQMIYWVLFDKGYDIPKGQERAAARSGLRDYYDTTAHYRDAVDTVYVYDIMRGVNAAGDFAGKAALDRAQACAVLDKLEKAMKKLDAAEAAELGKWAAWGTVALPEGKSLSNWYPDSNRRKDAEKAAKEVAGKFTYPEEYTLIGLSGEWIRQGMYIDLTTRNANIKDQSGNFYGSQGGWSDHMQKQETKDNLADYELFPYYDLGGYARVRRATAYQDGVAAKTEYEFWDEAGNLLKKEKRMPGAYNADLREYTYDDQGRVVTFHGENDGYDGRQDNAAYTYEVRGNQKITTRSGDKTVVTIETFDAQGRLVREEENTYRRQVFQWDTPSSRSVTTWSYDSQGLLSLKSYEDSYTSYIIRYTYDGQGRILKETRTGSNGTVTETNYTYFEDGSYQTVCGDTVERFDRWGSRLRYECEYFVHTYSYNKDGTVKAESYRDLDDSSESYDYIYLYEWLK